MMRSKTSFVIVMAMLLVLIAVLTGWPPAGADVEDQLVVVDMVRNPYDERGRRTTPTAETPTAGGRLWVLTSDGRVYRMALADEEPVLEFHSRIAEGREFVALEWADASAPLTYDPVAPVKHVTEPRRGEVGHMYAITTDGEIWRTHKASKDWYVYQRGWVMPRR